MNVKSVTQGEKSNAKLVIEIEKDQFQAALDKAYRQNKSEIYVPGFRKGKAPRKVVEGMYGKDIFYEDAINAMFPDVFAEAIENTSLKTVGSPRIEDLNVGDEGILTLTVNTDVYPEVTLGEYKGVEAYKPPVSVTDDDVQSEIDNLLERNSRIVTIGRAAQDGDTVVIDFEGFVDGVPFDGGKGEQHSLKLGSGTFIPGFEEQLVGTVAGEEKEVEVTFPENYTEELAGKAATFKCKVHEVKASEQPELDDEFAKDVSEFDTLEELKNDLKAKQTVSRENDSKSQFENNVIEKIVKEMTVDIPDSMVETRLDSLIEQFSYQIQSNGIGLQDYLNMIGADMETLRYSYRQMALAQLQSELVFNKVAEQEGIEVTDEDYEEECARMAEQYEMEIDKVKGFVPRVDIEYDLKLSKASKLIIDSAVATDTPPEPDEQTLAQVEEIVADAIEHIDQSAQEDIQE